LRRGGGGGGSNFLGVLIAAIFEIASEEGSSKVEKK